MIPEALESGSLPEGHASPRQMTQAQDGMSLSSTGVASFPMASVKSIDFALDPADPQLKIRHMMICFAQDQSSMEHNGIVESAPDLGQWITHCSKHELAEWIQGEVLSAHYAGEVHPQSNFEVHLPWYTVDGNELTLKASQATVHAAVCDAESTPETSQRAEATTHKPQFADVQSSYASQENDLVLLTLTGCVLVCHKHPFH